MNKHLRIVIAEPSSIIREGLLLMLKNIHGLNAEFASISDIEQLEYQLQIINPDILIINPAFLGIFSLPAIKSGSGCVNLKAVALHYAFSELPSIKGYDANISVYDSSETIKERIFDLAEKTDKGKIRHDSLSAREKEIIICVVKGMTNKQIADHLCLSTHTVVTHRRNIASKLQIHSPAGLTIYAIVNKLVELDDIKDGVTNLGEL